MRITSVLGRGFTMNLIRLTGESDGKCVSANRAIRPDAPVPARLPWGTPFRR